VSGESDNPHSQGNQALSQRLLRYECGIAMLCLLAGAEARPLGSST